MLLLMVMERLSRRYVKLSLASGVPVAVISDVGCS